VITSNSSLLANKSSGCRLKPFPFVRSNILALAFPRVDGEWSEYDDDRIRPDFVVSMLQTARACLSLWGSRRSCITSTEDALNVMAGGMRRALLQWGSVPASPRITSTLSRR
jgi:hypothetical protein